MDNARIEAMKKIVRDKYGLKYWEIEEDRILFAYGETYADLDIMDAVIAIEKMDVNNLPKNKRKIEWRVINYLIGYSIDC